MNIQKITIILLIGLFIGLLMGIYIGKKFADIEYLKIQDSLIAENNALSEQVKNLQAILKRKEKEDEFRKNAFNSHFPEYSEILSAVWEEAEKNDVNPNVILSIIETESNFNPNAVSWAGAHGLMQVKFDVWKNNFGLQSPKELYDIRKNVEIGVKIYKHYKEKSKGDIEKALYRYNAGYMKIKSTYPNKVMSSKFFNIGLK